MKIYRIENNITKHGMWYKDDGTYDPFILKLTEGISKNLPMEFDERYFEGGIKWYSGCGSTNQLKEWFSILDVVELMQNGYGLYELDVSQYKIEEHQVIFTREGILSKQELQIHTIWDINEINKKLNI